MNKFTLGIVAGIGSLAVAIPILAQVSSAASTSSIADMMKTRPPLTQEAVQAMVQHDTDFLTNIDAVVQEAKKVIQAHKDALTAAATLSDETQRQAAIQKAQEDMRAAIQAALTAHPEWKSAMMPMAFGGHKMGHGPKGMKHDPAALAEKLGMTAEELKTALEGGKTIQDLATEKGITLPAPPAWGMRGHMMNGAQTPSDTTAPITQ